MFKFIRITFLFQYVALVLIILSILIVVKVKSTQKAQVAIAQPLPSDPQVQFSPKFLHTELVIKKLFEGQQLQKEKLEPIVSFLDNHNIDLTIDLNEQTNPVEFSYQVSDALQQLGLAQNAFTIKVSNNEMLETGNAKVRLSWMEQVGAKASSPSAEAMGGMLRPVIFQTKLTRKYDNMFYLEGEV